MSRVLLRLLDLMRFRGGPQDLPGGWGLALVLSAAYGLEGMLADRMLDGNGAAPRSLVALAVQILAISVLMQVRRFPNRIPQTVSAIAGTGFLFSLLSVALLQIGGTDGFPPGLALVWFVVFLWSLAVDAHIYRHALSITMSLGVLVAVLVFALNFLVIEALFPA